MEIKVKKLSDNAIIPTQAHQGDAGYDLYAVEDYDLKPLERKLFKTNIAVAIPDGYYGRIAPRSGLAYKNGIDVLAGVIDSSYRNDVGVILINLSPQDLYERPLNRSIMENFLNPEEDKIYHIKKGDKIAQLIIERHYDAEFVVGDLDETDRNLGGFGSTGK